MTIIASLLFTGQFKVRKAAILTASGTQRMQRRHRSEVREHTGNRGKLYRLRPRPGRNGNLYTSTCV